VLLRHFLRTNKAFATGLKMPMIMDSLPTSAMGAFSPLRSNLEDMIVSCGIVNKHIGYMNEDKETFGLLTEETYCYDAPVGSRQLVTRFFRY